MRINVICFLIDFWYFHSFSLKNTFAMYDQSQLKKNKIFIFWNQFHLFFFFKQNSKKNVIKLRKWWNYVFGIKSSDWIPVKKDIYTDWAKEAFKRSAVFNWKVCTNRSSSKREVCNRSTLELFSIKIIHIRKITCLCNLSPSFLLFHSYLHLNINKIWLLSFRKMNDTPWIWSPSICPIWSTTIYD